MKGDYQVGYKKPPKDHQFKPKHLQERRAGGQRKETGPDIAALIDKPQKVGRGGKTVSMHPLEAEVTSLGIRALKGDPPSPGNAMRANTTAQKANRRISNASPMRAYAASMVSAAK